MPADRRSRAPALVTLALLACAVYLHQRWTRLQKVNALDGHAAAWVRSSGTMELVEAEQQTVFTVQRMNGQPTGARRADFWQGALAYWSVPDEALAVWRTGYLVGWAEGLHGSPDTAWFDMTAVFVGVGVVVVNAEVSRYFEEPPRPRVLVLAQRPNLPRLYEAPGEARLQRAVDRVVARSGGRLKVVHGEAPWRGPDLPAAVTDWDVLPDSDALVVAQPPGVVLLRPQVAPHVLLRAGRVVGVRVDRYRPAVWVVVERLAGKNRALRCIDLRGVRLGPSIWAEGASVEPLGFVLPADVAWFHRSESR